MLEMRNIQKLLLKARLLAALALLSISGACALLGSGNIDVPHADNYQVTAPRSWKEFHQPESDRAYRLPSGNIVALNSSCNGHSQVALEILTRDLLIGDRNIEYTDQRRFKVAGTEGLYSAVTLTLNKVPFHLRLFVVPAEGCVFDFSLLSEHPIPESDTQGAACRSCGHPGAGVQRSPRAY